MGAPAIVRPEPMRESAGVHASADGTAGGVSSLPNVKIIPFRISRWEELVFMLPVLAATALAAIITTLPFGQETLFGLLCVEVVLIVVSISFSVSRPKKVK